MLPVDGNPKVGHVSYGARSGSGGFTAENMTFNETCFQRTSLRRPIEWWYFDAVLDSGYSVEWHIDMGAAGHGGVVAAMINIYRHEKLVVYAEELHTREIMDYTRLW